MRTLFAVLSIAVLAGCAMTPVGNYHSGGKTTTTTTTTTPATATAPATQSTTTVVREAPPPVTYVPAPVYPAYPVYPVYPVYPYYYGPSMYFRFGGGGHRGHWRR